MVGRFNSNCLTREVFVRNASNQKRKSCMYFLVVRYWRDFDLVLTISIGKERRLRKKTEF